MMISVVCDDEVGGGAFGAGDSMRTEETGDGAHCADSSPCIPYRWKTEGVEE